MELMDPQTYSLNVTNIALGAVTIICLLSVVIAFCCDQFTRRRRNAAGPSARA